MRAINEDPRENRPGKSTLVEVVIWSAFLKTSPSGGTTNGRVLPTGKRNNTYSSFLVFTEMTSLSLNHLLRDGKPVLC